MIGATLAPQDSIVVTDLSFYCGNCRSDGRGGPIDTLRVYSGGSAEPLNIEVSNVNYVAAEGVPATTTLSLTLAPNPAPERTTLTLTRAAAGDVRVVACDALGREVAVLHDGPAPEALTLRLDTSAWPPGVYVVRAGADGQMASTRLVVAR